jgi:hypothetical protein
MLGPRYMFGYVDRKPLRDPREAGSRPHDMAKYLTKTNPTSSFRSSSVQLAGRSSTYFPRPC